MKSRWNSLVAGGCNVVGLTLLALSATAGGSAVRAAGDSPALESIAIEPLAKVVSGLEQRVAAFETYIGTFATSYSPTHIAVRELCVADDAGAQTCITKAQLDALLKGAMQTAQAPQTSQPPEPETHASEQGACPEKCVAPAVTVAAPTPPETPPAIEPAAVKEATAAALTAAIEETTAPDAAGAVAAATEKAPAEGAASAETVIATTVKPESLIPTEAPAKEEGPATTSGSAATEPDAVPAEALTESERKQ